MQVEISYGPCGADCDAIHVTATWRDPLSQYWIRTSRDFSRGVGLLDIVASVAAGAPSVRRCLGALPFGLMMDGNDLKH